ncbi:MAG: hypothetical protein IPJ68_03330 [Candidatus Moraniibacteriota bacterium]|nr:MAG: hypothetical protein IPJ68_03330 [Candidatus Moranbacteria bacterium]
MEQEPRTASVEQRGPKKFGTGIVIRNFWVRHAQKTSGEIINAEMTSITSDLISEDGAEKSKQYGEAVVSYEHGVKGYASSSGRTAQTLEKILEGYQTENPDKPIRSMRVREELTSHTPKEFLSLYDQKFTEQKRRILSEMGLPENGFASLSPGEQERIAEAAEEPIIREWLDNPESQLSKSYPPIEAAARFARLFNRRHERLAGKLYSKSEIDLFHVTHKTITEPFLISGVLVRKSNGERITTLQQLGGSLATLGDWQSEVTTGDTGGSKIIIRIRGEEYDIDHSVLENLLQAQIEKEG